MKQILPPDLQQEKYDLSNKGLAKIMANVASKYPDDFPKITKQLGDLGRNAAWYQGYTTGPKDTRKVIDTQKYFGQMDAELADLKKQDLDPEEFNEQRAEIMVRYSDIISKATSIAAKKSGNAFAAAVNSGARGNNSHLSAILSTPGVYQDANGKIIPLFARNSFGGGVRPAEMLASTYGARHAVTSTKRATAKGGDLLKIMTQNTLNFNVTEDDCGVTNGLALEAEDESLLGRVLAQPAAGLESGALIDKKALAAIRRSHKPVVARSTMTCRAAHGLCKKCAGVQADGKFPNIGDSLGVTASASIGEPVVQGSLNTKHNSGMAKGKRAFSGLEYLTQFMQVPEDFKDRAAVAEQDGNVESIVDAPQGGTYITVNGEQHFALPGFEPTVKVGQKVEAGEQLSEGLINPADIVRLQGLGAGRMYYKNRLQQMLQDSGQNPDARNVELLSRATVDSYKMTDPGEEDPWGVDDSINESTFLRGYKPPEDTRLMGVSNASNKYLQEPTLHYSVGTRITPRVATDMETHGVKEISVSGEKPNYETQMKRLRVAAHDDRDWLVSMGTSYLSNQLRDSLERGDETNVRENYHYGPRLAFGADAGSGGFGDNIKTTGKF